MVRRPATTQSLEDEIAEFGEGFEKPIVRRRPSSLPVKNRPAEPAWKRRNREPKHIQIMLRASESQRALLQAAADHQEKSQQKILEEIVWPVLEEQYGAEAVDEVSPS